MKTLHLSRVQHTEATSEVLFHTNDGPAEQGAFEKREEKNTYGSPGVKI